MKIKNIIIAFSIIFLNTISYCQVDLNLLDISKEWYHIQQDTTLPSLQDTFPNLNSEITGYENIRTAYSLIDNDLIEVFTTGINFGTYITCTNAITGESKWKNSYNLTTDDKIEIDLNLFSRSDGNIELSGMRLLQSTVPNNFPFGIATRKIIDRQTGELISKKYQNFEDGGCVCNNTNGQLGRTLPIIEDDLYMTVCTYPSSDGQQIQILQRLDNEGKLLDTLSFISNPLMNSDIQSHKLISFNQLDESRFLIGSGSTSNPLDTNLTITELLFVDNNGQLIMRNDISSLINFSPSFQQEYKNEKIYISSTSLNNNTADPNDLSHSLLILDNQGSLLNNIIGYEALDNEEVGLLRVAQLDTETYILLGAKDNCLKYFSLDFSGSIRHLKTVCYSDSAWKLSPMFIELNENGDIINGVRCTNIDGKSFEVTFAFKQDEIFATNSIFDHHYTEKDKAIIFPNLSSTSIAIKYQESINGIIQISSLSGSLIKELNLNNESEKHIDISNLPEGSYSIRTIGKKIVLDQQFVKIN